MAAPAPAADASADMPTFKLVLVGDGGTGEYIYYTVEGTRIPANLDSDQAG